MNTNPTYMAIQAAQSDHYLEARRLQHDGELDGAIGALSYIVIKQMEDIAALKSELDDYNESLKALVDHGKWLTLKYLPITIDNSGTGRRSGDTV